MKQTICLLVYVCLLLSCSKNEDNMSTNDTDLIPGVNEIIIDHTINGTAVPRSVYIRTPPTYNPSASYPIVFFFHGAGGSGRVFLNNDHIVELINDGAFVGIFPNGHSDNNRNERFWNLGSEPTSADDVEFVNLIMEQLETIPAMNLSKSYAIGFSNGAGMVNLLAKSTSHFNAIAPLFSQQITSTGALIPPRPLSVYQLNGEFDDIVPLAGGTSAVGTFLSAENSALNWANNFNCQPQATQENLNWHNLALQSHTYNNCDAGHTIKYIIAFDTGHGLGSYQADQLLFSDVWQFFEQH